MKDVLLALLKLVRPFALLRWGVYVGAAAIVWIIFDFPLLQQYVQARERRNDYRQQVAQEQQRQNSLKLEHDALQKGGFAAEKAIRERARMKRPDEHVLFIETPAPQPAATPGKPAHEAPAP